MKCLFFERYAKQTIEEFALRTISKSFDSSYGQYSSPNDTDNFDGISPDGKRALEITLVVSKNDMNGYVYEKLHAQGKCNLRTNHIRNAKIKDSGELLQWQGGPIYEIVKNIQKAVDVKNAKAKQRLSTQKFDSVDLCICIDDGGWFDENDFPLINVNLSSTLFENIFFITSALFFRYTRSQGFEKYNRII